MIAIGEKVVMQTALAKVGDGDCTTVETRIMLDTGSSRTYITEELAKHLKLNTVEEKTF